MAYDNFCKSSAENGLSSSVNKKAMAGYPLHKALAEDKSAEQKYGNNGLTNNKKGK